MKRVVLLGDVGLENGDGLNIISSKSRMASIPKHHRRQARYRAVTHSASWPDRWCKWFTSKVYLAFGRDDGVLKPKSAYPWEIGSENILEISRPYCHSEKMHADDARTKQSVAAPLCDGSVLGPAGLCPV